MEKSEHTKLALVFKKMMVTSCFSWSVLTITSVLCFRPGKIWCHSETSFLGLQPVLWVLAVIAQITVSRTGAGSEPAPELPLLKGGIS